MRNKIIQLNGSIDPSLSGLSYSVGIVTYYPNLQQLVSNIKTFCTVNSVLIIFDNTDDPTIALLIKSTIESNYPNVLYLSVGRNTGIGYALNRIFEISKSKGLEACLTMDQDSCFENFSEYLLYAEKNKTNFSYLSPSYSRDSTDIDRYFTSGSIVKIDCWAAINGFDVELFIDEVDGDFVYRLKRSGFKLLKHQGSLLTHQLGESKCKPVFSRKICSANHSAIRKYYIARNRTYLFVRRKDMRWIYFKDSVIKLIQFIVVEENKFTKIRMIIRGVVDGLKGKLGEFHAN